MANKIQNEIEERIDQKICVSGMNIDIDRFIKELKSLNMDLYNLEELLDLLKGLDTESRIN